MPPLVLTLFGGFEARLGSGRPLVFATKKAQALLAYLAVRPGTTHPRDKLAALLWGESADDKARGSLRYTLGVLKKALGPAAGDILDPDRQTIGVAPTALDVDVVRFEALLAQRTPEALEAASALYHGDLLEGLVVDASGFEEWLTSERERLRERALEALARLLNHQMKHAPPEPGVQTARRLLALDPLLEAGHRALMRLYARSGRRADALRQYQTCVEAIHRELGAEPEPETKLVYRQIVSEMTASVEPALPARPGPPQTVERPAGSVPFVGRDAEMAELRAAFVQAEAGRAAVVAVLGEAGVGKTRLVAELVDLVAAGGAHVLFGRAYESEQILAFGVWVQALRAADVFAADGPARELDPVWQAELARLFPEIGKPLPPPTGLAEDHLRLFEAVARVVTHLAERTPLLIVLEDLHWADPMTLRLLPFVARRAAASRVLLVTTAREEDLTTGLTTAIDELRRQPQTNVIALKPLSRDATAALVAATGPRTRRPGAEIVDHVWLLSEGNPFVALETIRALEEADDLQVVERAALPERVRAMIRGRLDRLGSCARVLADVAAVVGRDADFAVLRDAAGIGEAAAADGLEELVRRRVLCLTGDAFAFTHDRIREVVYGDLLPPRQAVLHASVARALEAVHAGDLERHYAALGLHYRQGRVWDRAVQYLDQAGVQAAGRSAHDQATVCFEQALAALAHLPPSAETQARAIDLRLRLRNSLMPLDRNARIEEHLREAERIAEAAGDHVRLNRVAGCMTEFFCVSAQYEAAVEAGRRALDAAEASGDIGSRGEVNFFVGCAAFSLGAYAEAEDALTRGLRAVEGAGTFERFGLPFLLSTACRCWLSWALAERGAFDEAHRRAAEIAPIARAVDHSFSRAEAHLAAGVVYARQGNHGAAIVELEEGRTQCDAAHIVRLVPFIASHLGYAYALAGRAGEAVASLSRAVEAAETARLMIHRSRWMTMLGEACLSGGRFEEAEGHAWQAVDLARTHHERGHEAWALRLLGEIAERRAPPKIGRAEKHYDEALALAEALGMRPLVAHCHLGRGRLYAAAGRQAEAPAELAAAGEAYRAMAMTFWLARAEAASVLD